VLTGTVEQLSVRTIWLRSNDAASMSFRSARSPRSRQPRPALPDVTVPFTTATARAVLSEIAAELRQDPDFAPLGDLKLLGADAVKRPGS
jgi:hypothetical protein